MEKWAVYGLIAAFLIAGRDIFTKKFSNKYSPIEHLLYYYMLCGFFIILLAFSVFLFTEMPISSKFSLFESITDRAFSPILPDAPRMNIFFKSMILPYIREVKKIKSLE